MSLWQRNELGVATLIPGCGGYGFSFLSEGNIWYSPEFQNKLIDKIELP